MRAVCFRDGVDMNSIAKAAASEIQDHLNGGGRLDDAILVIQIRSPVEEEKENGTVPQRKARSR